MTEPECTCDEGRHNVCHQMGTEPHYVGCPRWGMPLYDLGGVIPPGVAWVRNDTGEDEEVRPA